ncbi:MAG: peptidase [Alphaproteobacteria bacterium]|nr:peptidase [Alphaproteobacteria bacterium]
MSDAYQQLKERQMVLHHLGNGARVLGWDMEVMMPPKAAAERGETMATLSALMHEKATEPAIAELISQAEELDLPEMDKRNLGMIRENYLLASHIPEKLVYALEEATDKTVTIWKDAKPKNDWQAVLPALQELFSLIREQAQIKAEILNRTIYDAQLYGSARGNSQAVIDPLFAMLKENLPPLVQEITEKQRGEGGNDKKIRLSVGAQKKIARRLVQKLGYRFTSGRLDVAAHPFSSSSREDGRITTRYSKETPFTSLYGAMHETGHALYTKKLPLEWEGQPIGGESDMSLHESQSLIMEKQAGLSDGFIHYLHGLVVQQDAEFSIRTSTEEMKRNLRQIKPGFIRVDADEATYPLHVVLRYEMEKKLFSGEITVADIPQVWNDGFKELLGLEVKEHRLGCMQDIHWFWGLFGYFPTYTQGALYAAQLYAAMKRDMPDIEDDLGMGKFKRFNRWLNDNIHRHGQAFDAPELIARATGENPDARFFLQHLRKRYLQE